MKRTAWQRENERVRTTPHKPVGWHCDDCWNLAVDCECCDLPLNRSGEKSKGIGYYCDRCIGHFNAGTAPWGNHEAELQQVEDDHRAMWDEFMGVQA
jgi:hypothetical protein